MLQSKTENVPGVFAVASDHSEGEERMVTFGLSSAGRLLVVAHTERGDAIRTISVRVATQHESTFMKKAKSASDELRPEYKRSDFGKLERGRYCQRVKASSNVVVFDAELAAVFPNSVSVNKALHSLVEVAQKASGLTGRSTGRGKRRCAD